MKFKVFEFVVDKERRIRRNVMIEISNKQLYLNS